MGEPESSEESDTHSCQKCIPDSGGVLTSKDLLSTCTIIATRDEDVVACVRRHVGLGDHHAVGQVELN